MGKEVALENQIFFKSSVYFKCLADTMVKSAPVFNLQCNYLVCGSEGQRSDLK